MITMNQAQPAVKPAAVVLFDSASRRQPRPFGKGLLRSLPTHRVDYSAADAREWAEESARLERRRLAAELDAEVEAMALEYHATRAYKAGYAAC